jgi:putative Holliday junction resolvase
MGIDYGTKRVGIAVSDESAAFAMPLLVHENSKSAASFSKLVHDIVEIARENGVEEIVLGESKNYKGAANAVMAESLELKKALESKGLTVHLEPEFMTSLNAERTIRDLKGKNDMLDASAAALILQSFLDKLSKQDMSGKKD